MQGVTLAVVVMVCYWKTTCVSSDEILSAPSCGYKAWRNLGPGKTGMCVCEKGWHLVANGIDETMYCREPCSPTNAECSEGTTCAEVENNQYACVCSQGYRLSSYGECLEIASVPWVVGCVASVIFFTFLITRKKLHWAVWKQVDGISRSTMRLLKTRKSYI